MAPLFSATTRLARLENPTADVPSPHNPTNIDTGIGFLNHMLDQFPSHGRVSVECLVGDAPQAQDAPPPSPHDTAYVNRHGSYSGSTSSTSSLLLSVGASLGKSLRDLLPPGAHEGSFLCPLDEALSEVCITTSPSDPSDPSSPSFSPGSLTRFTLPNSDGTWGAHGTTNLGSLPLKDVKGFFEQLAKESGANIQINRIRGDNGNTRGTE